MIIISQHFLIFNTFMLWF